MGQLLLSDNIPPLVKASSTTLTLAPTYLGQPTVITVGGQQYLVPAQLTLNCATSGVANGLDTGSLIASSSYYVYAVVNQSTYAVALVASLNTPSTGPTHPSGYGTAEKWIGGFITDGASAIASVLQGNQVSSPISSANIVGRTDGVAPAAGMVGETISATVAGTASAGAYGLNATITLTAGEWSVSGQIAHDSNTGTTGLDALLNIKGVTGTLANFGRLLQSNPTASFGCVAFSPRTVRVAVGDATKTVVLQGKATGSDSDCWALVSAVRIA